MEEILKDGEALVRKFEHGITLWQIITVKALDREGKKMWHCFSVENSENQKLYRQRIGSRNYQYYSLRDATDNPVVTIEIKSDENMLFYAQWKNRNKIADPYYVPYLLRWVREEQIDVSKPFIKSLGIIYQDGNYYNVYDLPSNYRHKGSLNVRGMPITQLPEGLEIEKDLIIEDTFITALGKGLKVGGNVFAGNTPLKVIDPDIKIGEQLIIDGSLGLYLSPKFFRNNPSCRVSESWKIPQLFWNNSEKTWKVPAFCQKRAKIFLAERNPSLRYSRKNVKTR